VVRPPGFEPAPHGLRPFGDNETLLNDFREFCRIDLQLSNRTFHDGHVPIAKRFLRTVDKPISLIQVNDIREYLSGVKADSEPKTYNNYLCGLKRFFRDFLSRPDLVSSFKFAPINEKPITVLTRPDLQRFYSGLEPEPAKYRLAFVLFAVTWLRRNEVLTLQLAEIDRPRRMITPNGAHETSRTKKSWLSFYNTEAERLLEQYLNETGIKSGELLRSTESGIRKAFKRAEERTGIVVKPQMLREWFCNELGKLGVPDRFVDALCGRLPHSVLARRYTDYNPDNLKAIYDKANLTVLT
jgi:integrase